MAQGSERLKKTRRLDHGRDKLGDLPSNRTSQVNLIYIYIYIYMIPAPQNIEKKIVPISVFPPIPWPKLTVPSIYDVAGPRRRRAR